MELFSSALRFFSRHENLFSRHKNLFSRHKKMANLEVSLLAQNCANFPIEAIMPLFTTIDFIFYIPIMGLKKRVRLMFLAHPLCVGYNVRNARSCL
jgi:hypothetical protein